MRVVIQNVLQANVLVDNKEIARINEGFLLFVGFTFGDTKQTIEKMVNKILKLRILPDKNRKTNLSITDIDGDILSVSQFTLYANTVEGRRPSFVDALTPNIASELYDYFNSYLENSYKHIEKGMFGADMREIGRAHV